MGKLSLVFEIIKKINTLPLTGAETLSIRFFTGRSLLYFWEVVVISHYTKEAAHVVNIVGIRALCLRWNGVRPDIGK